MSIIYALLAFLCLSGIIALFLFRDYSKKILAISTAYGSFLLLIILMALQIDRQNEILNITVTILIIFSINLFVAFGMVKILKNEESK